MGGTVAQEGYALAIRRGPEVARLGPHPRGPRAFLPARVLDAGGPRVGDGRAPFVARFVAPWAFPAPFFEERGEGLAGFEAQLAALSVPTLVLAGEEGTPIPVPPSRRLREAVPGSGRATTEGDHGGRSRLPAGGAAGGLQPGRVLEFLGRQGARGGARPGLQYGARDAERGHEDGTAGQASPARHSAPDRLALGRPPGLGLSRTEEGHSNGGSA